IAGSCARAEEDNAAGRVRTGALDVGILDRVIRSIGDETNRGRSGAGVCVANGQVTGWALGSKAAAVGAVDDDPLSATQVKYLTRARTGNHRRYACGRSDRQSIGRARTTIEIERDR